MMLQKKQCHVHHYVYTCCQKYLTKKFFFNVQGLSVILVEKLLRYFPTPPKKIVRFH